MHGAAGWQMNVHAYRRTQSLGFRYASDTRGTHPFIPVIRAEIVRLPAISDDAADAGRADRAGRRHRGERRAERCSSAPREPRDHVFTLHAELEGMKLAPVFEKLLEGWKAQGYELCAMREMVNGVEPAKLPLHSVVDAPRQGRSGTLASQGPAFLPEESFP